MKRKIAQVACLVVGGLLCAASAVRPDDRATEYRLTAYPSYRITDKVNGLGYVGWVSKPDAEYDAYYLATGAFAHPTDRIQLWLGVIGIYTDFSNQKSDLLELRPFAGVKFMGANEKRKWRYYNWTRYELRETETLDSNERSTVHRLRNQTRLEIPLAALERAWTPKSYYLLADVEPIYRSDTGQIDPLRFRAGVGYIATPRLLVELQVYAQYTRPGGAGLEYTDNIFRLNFKILTKKGLLSAFSGDMDD